MVYVKTTYVEYVEPDYRHVLFEYRSDVYEYVKTELHNAIALANELWSTRKYYYVVVYDGEYSYYCNGTMNLYKH